MRSKVRTFTTRFPFELAHTSKSPGSANVLLRLYISVIKELHTIKGSRNVEKVENIKRIGMIEAFWINTAYSDIENACFAPHLW